MKKIRIVICIFFLMLSVLFTPVLAAGEAALEPADTGDIFGIVIAMLLTSAMGVAALVVHRTRFVHEDTKKAGG